MTGTVVRPAVPDPPEVSERLWAGFSGDVGWDVGANCGQSVPVMRQLFRRVISFEPYQESFDYAKSQLPDAELYRIAVSDHVGQTELALLNGVQADTGQLVTPGTSGMEWDPGDWSGGNVTIRQVPCRTLDALALSLGEPDFVKVDTEGHELRVLLGGAGLLDGGKTSWLVEFHSPSLHDLCEQLLSETGHQVETVRHPHYAPGSPMWHQHGWLRAWPEEG
jgi:FkbM family methyltransferase